jgi:hypothetical protein
MLVVLIPILTTSLAVLFVLVLISAVVYSFSRAIGDVEKDAENSQTFLGTRLNQYRLLVGRYSSTPSDQSHEQDN